MTQKGFTFIEVLIAIAILLIGALAFVPLFVYASETAETNNRKAVAASLANGEIEKIRAMEFTNLGIKGGEPNGELSKTDSLTVNGVKYDIQRNISWISEGADCTEDDGTDPLWDAKFVQITVSTDAPNKKRVITETMETIISRSVFQEASPGYGIRICAFRGWQENNEKKVPVGGVQVSLSGPKSTWTSTNNRGAALFFLQENEVGSEKKYTVKVEAPVSMMVMPGDEEFELTINKNGEKWAKKSVSVEYPCWLDLTVRDAKTGNQVSISDYTGSHLMIRSRFYLDGQTKDISSPVVENIGPLWPLGSGEVGAYGLSLRNIPGYHDAEGNEHFIIRDQSDENPWDGTFPKPGSRLALTTYLVPIPPTPGDDEAEQATSLDWLNGSSHVVTTKENIILAEDDEGNLTEVVWRSGNFQDTIKLNNDNRSIFTASAMYWERNFFTKAHMRVAAELHVFNGWVQLGDENHDGKLSLFVPDEFGIPGSRIEAGDPELSYGIVHFVKGVFTGNPQNEENLIVKGAYYFPHGVELPSGKEQLIPWYQLD